MPDHDGAHHMSDVFRWYLGGLIATAREFSLLLAPNVNSYKRFQPGSWAPTAIGWDVDNRTLGFRVVGHGEGMRVESRIPGADANCYHAFAASIAAGLHGIEHRIEPPPPYAGNGYTATDLPRIPTTFVEAIELWRTSDIARERFGDDVHHHVLHHAEAEWSAFNRTVTDWERAPLLRADLSPGPVSDAPRSRSAGRSLRRTGDQTSSAMTSASERTVDTSNTPSHSSGVVAHRRVVDEPVGPRFGVEPVDPAGPLGDRAERLGAGIAEVAPAVAGHDERRAPADGRVEELVDELAEHGAVVAVTVEPDDAAALEQQLHRHVVRPPRRRRRSSRRRHRRRRSCAPRRGRRGGRARA